MWSLIRCTTQTHLQRHTHTNTHTCYVLPPVILRFVTIVLEKSSGLLLWPALGCCLSFYFILMFAGVLLSNAPGHISGWYTRMCS